METYWHQLQGRPGDKGLFWGLNLAMLIAMLFLFFHDESNTALAVFLVLLGIQALNALGTYFSKEQRRKRA